MKRYVDGFLFTPDFRHVVLIQKKRPSWQVGKLNGVGGHIEANESPTNAMAREFKEETGVEISIWNHFCTLQSPAFEVFFYWATSPGAGSVQTVTDEPVDLVPVELVPRLPTVPNLQWLIPMALSMRRGESALGFTIIERHGL